jgi:hypothetical protein
MDFIKNGMDNLMGLGFGAAVPGLRDSVKNVVGNLTSSDNDQKAKIQAVIDADRAEQEKMMSAIRRSQGSMTRQNPTTNDGAYKGYKKGGKVKKSVKVSSASKRADGCAIKGKTKGRMI